MPRAGQAKLCAPLLAALASAALFCAAARAEARDILRNGGFEQPGIAWSLSGEWLDDPALAFDGRHCVAGQVDGPDQMQVLEQQVPLTPDAIYRLGFWARGTTGTKIAAWIRSGNTRRQLAEFLRMPPDWTHHEIAFSVDRSDTWTLELVAPTSVGAAPGRVWVDEATLLETPVAADSAWSEGAGIHDFPAVAADGAGRLYMAWIEARDRADRLHLAIAEPQGAALRILKHWIEPLDSDAIESVTLAGHAAGAWGCASAESARGWDLYCFGMGRQGAVGRWWIPGDAATDIHPALAVSGEQAWVVWESNREAKRQIFATALPPSRGQAPLRLSDGSDSSYFPAVAGDGAGGLWAAWQQFVDGQYDLYLARFDGTRWLPARRLTNNPYLEHRPSLAWTPGGLWVAWELTEFPSYRTSYARWRRLLAARVTGEGALEAPAGAWDAFPEWSSNPRLVAAPDGSLHLSLRVSRGRSANWDARLASFDGTRWGEPLAVNRLTGRNRPTPLAVAGGRVWAVTQTDNIEGSWNSVEESGGIVSAISAASVALGGAVPSPTLAPLALPATSFDPASLRETKGEDRGRFSILYEGRRLNLYFGQLHEHSEISVCNRQADLAPDDNYNLNRDLHRLDFSALTDHDFNTSVHIWNWLGKLARWQHDPRRHVTFLAQEWTSSFDEGTAQNPHGYYGHRNLILADPTYPRWYNAREGMTPGDVWRSLREDHADFIHVPHQLADASNVPVDWTWVDEEAQPVAEIFQHRGSYEQEDAPKVASPTVPGRFLTDAWNSGVVIGTIASPDHGGGRGKAAVFAPVLTRESILDGCRARHTYGTTGARIWLDFRVDGRLMGEKVALREGPVTVTVLVSGTQDLRTVEILRGGEVVYSARGSGRDLSLTWTDPQSPRDGTYYYARVRQVDNEMAWSSPVWFRE